MEIHQGGNEGVVSLRIEGSIDADHIGSIEAEFQKICANPRTVTIDLSETGLVHSAFLAPIMKLSNTLKDHGKKLHLFGLPMSLHFFFHIMRRNARYAVVDSKEELETIIQSLTPKPKSKPDVVIRPVLYDPTEIE